MTVSKNKVIFLKKESNTNEKLNSREKEKI